MILVDQCLDTKDTGTPISSEILFATLLTKQFIIHFSPISLAILDLPFRYITYFFIYLPSFLLIIFWTVVTKVTFTTNMQFYITIMTYFSTLMTTVGLTLSFGYGMVLSSNFRSYPSLHSTLKSTLDPHLKKCLQIITQLVSHSWHFPLSFIKLDFIKSISLAILSTSLKECLWCCSCCIWDDKLLNCWLTLAKTFIHS